MIKVAFQIRDKRFVQLIPIHSSAHTLPCKMINLTLTISSQEMLRPSAPRQEVFTNQIPDSRVPNAVNTHTSHPVIFFSGSNMTTENTMEATLNSLKPNGSNAMGHAISAPDSCITNSRKKFSFFTPSTPSICNPS